MSHLDDKRAETERNDPVGSEQIFKLIETLKLRPIETQAQAFDSQEIRLPNAWIVTVVTVISRGTIFR